MSYLLEGSGSFFSSDDYLFFEEFLFNYYYYLYTISCSVEKKSIIDCLLGINVEIKIPARIKRICVLGERAIDSIMILLKRNNKFNIDIEKLKIN